jgi:D-aminopeptidase
MHRFRTVASWILMAATALPCALGGEGRPGARELGIEPGVLQPGPLNAITDVKGVRVGHVTLIREESIRTGVTAIVPADGNVFQSKLPAAVYVGNGFGKAAGFLQVAELGNIETPIVLTNTLSVGTAVEATVAWTLAQPGNEQVRSVNAIVGETNDGYLNDIRGQHVKPSDVVAAIEAATTGVVEEGSVGAGTGTRAFGWKGGIGTSSRKLPPSLGGYTVGALVQSNFGGVLTIDGIKVGELLGRYAYRDRLSPESTDGARLDRASPSTTGSDEGSVMVVLATDAPLSARNLERLARRAVLGLARTGSFMSNGSGDFVVAFSTRNRKAYSPEGNVRTVEHLYNDDMGPLFLAVVESVEEAVYNSILKATTVKGHQGHTVEALPIEELLGSGLEMQHSSNSP